MFLLTDVFALDYMTYLLIGQLNKDSSISSWSTDMLLCVCVSVCLDAYVCLYVCVCVRASGCVCVYVRARERVCE